MPGHDLELRTEAVSDGHVIHVVGELDLSTVTRFEAEVDALAARGRVLVVLSECTFIDSSALRSLVRGERAARDNGHDMAIIAPTEPARRVLEISALERFIPVFNSIDEAVTSPA